MIEISLEDLREVEKVVKEIGLISNLIQEAHSRMETPGALMPGFAITASREELCEMVIFFVKAKARKEGLLEDRYGIRLTL